MTTMTLPAGTLWAPASGSRAGIAKVFSQLRDVLARVGQRRAAHQLLERADALQDSEPSYAADLRAAAALLGQR